jgi:hypothetical protein
MCKELPVILVDKVVDLNRIIGKKWRAEEEGEAQGVADPKKQNKPNKKTEAIFKGIFIPTNICALGVHRREFLR